MAESKCTQTKEQSNITSYCQAASSALEQSPEARFVVVNTSLEIERTDKAALSVGLHCIRRVDVCGRAGKPPLFSVHVFAWQRVSVPDVTCISIRCTQGQFTNEALDVYKDTGKPPAQPETQTVPKGKLFHKAQVEQ